MKCRECEVKLRSEKLYKERYGLCQKCYQSQKKIAKQMMASPVFKWFKF